jgi:hypothetical protein
MAGKFPMASTDKLLARVSTWGTVALLIGILAVPFLPSPDPVPPPRHDRSHSAPPLKTQPPNRQPPAANTPALVPPLATPGIPPPTAKRDTAAGTAAHPASEGPGAPPSAGSPAPAFPPAAPAQADSSQLATPPEDVWTEAEVRDGLRACVQELAPVAVEVTLEEPMKKGPCGTPAPLRLRSIGASSKVVFDPAPEVNCRLAAGLASFVDRVLQPAAREVLGSPITRIVGSYAYSCRHMYSNSKLPLSEHATGNAIDIAGFVTADGRTVRVKKAWGPTERDIAAAKAKAENAKKDDKQPAKTKGEAGHGDEAAKSDKPSVHKAGLKPGAEAPASGAVTASTTKEAVFLKRVHHDACSVFGTVLGPEANEAHRDHLHLDMKKRKRHAICH